jgi:hypothetical protein
MFFPHHQFFLLFLLQTNLFGKLVKITTNVNKVSLLVEEEEEKKNFLLLAFFFASIE